METNQNEIVIAKQQQKLMKLTSHNLPKSRKKYLELHYGCKKVREYNEEDYKKLFKFMLALCKLAGVTEAPDKEIVMLLIDHIQEHHKDFSKEEIQNAFSLAMAGKLEMEFKHYNRLTPQLISNVCNAYRVYRAKEIVAYEDKLRKEEREAEEEKRRLTPEQQAESDINSAVLNFKAYRLVKEKDPKGSRVNDWGNIRYDFLDRIGMINYTNEEKIEIKEKAKKKLISEKKKLGLRVAKDEFETALNVRNVNRAIAEIRHSNSILVVSASKQLALDMFYDKIIEDKKDFEDLIKKAVMDSGNQILIQAAKKVLS